MDRTYKLAVRKDFANHRLANLMAASSFRRCCILVPAAVTFIKSQAKLWATAELISLLRRECNDAFFEQETKEYPNAYDSIIRELVSSKRVHELIDTFRRSTDKEQLIGLLEVMDRIGGKEIEQALKSMANRSIEETSFLAVKYLAKQDERLWALAQF